MTIQMTIALAIVVLMIVMIMSDKFSFGAPPLVACCLMVLTGVSTIERAFCGFVDSNVIMIAGFMAVMAGLQKTSLMSRIKSLLSDLAGKGGFKAYVLLLIVVMLGASVMGNTTGYYMLVLTIVASIPYNKNLPNSKLLMPLGFATGRALIPVSVAFFMGLASSLLESSNYENTISMAQFSIMMFIMSVGYLLWVLIAYRFLPDHDVSQGANSISENEESAAPALPKWKEYCTYGAFLVSVAAMFLLDTLGQAGYILPCLATAFLCLIGVFNFKEVRANVFSPLILMMASVIGVAGALADTGFTAMVGEAVANAMGGNVNPFVLVLVFCLLTSACATLTGASIGALFIFAPIGIATCMSLGLNPTGLAAAMTAAAWGGGFLPIDGLPAMILGMGKYKLSQFFKFALPMYFIQILALAIGAMVAFPM